MVLGGPNAVVWVDSQPQPDQNSAVSWSAAAKEDDITTISASTFKPMLETDWFMNPPPGVPNHDLHTLQNHLEIRDLGFCSSNPADNAFLLPQSIDSSASCSPSQAFALDPSFLAPKSCFSSLLSNNPFDNAFDFASETTFLGQFQPNLMGFTQNQVGSTEFSSNSEFQASRLLTMPENSPALGGGFNNGGGFEVFDGAKISKHLEDFPSIRVQPTLFQKRAMRQGSSAGAEKLGNLEVSGLRFRGAAKRKRSEDGEIEEGSINYDSDELDEDDSKVEESEKNGGGTSNAANSTVTGLDQKGKKKGMPAKNLMAERRRRKKLNDRLYMLRSVVPKISKMDRASILGDAIDYLKELLQRINDLHNELESTPPASLMPPSTNFLPLTPTPSTLPSRVKEELCSSSLPSPKNQTAKVEVRMREGRAVNIHMFCARRPGLLLSTMRALDNLGLDIQQAVISCFNGFALDVFQAEQCREGQEMLPEQIKAMLLDSAGLHGMM